MPFVETGPADHVAGMDVRPFGPRGRGVPVGEVSDLEAAVVAIERHLAASRVMHLPALDGEDAVRHAGRGQQGGLRVVHGDVDAEVVAAVAGIVECSVERVRCVQRRGRPARVVVVVVVAEPVGQRTVGQQLRGAQPAAVLGVGVVQARRGIARDPRRLVRPQGERRRYEVETVVARWRRRRHEDAMNACIDGRGGLQHGRAAHAKGARGHAEAREDDAGRRRVERWHARELRARRGRALRQHEERREDTAAEQRDEAEQRCRAAFHHTNV